MAISKDVINRTNQFIKDNDQFFKEAPVNINEIVNVCKITKKEYPFDNDISGVLIIDKSNQKVTIGVNSNTISEQRKNFTVAHELGHFILHNNNMSNTFVDNIFFRKKAEGYLSLIHI